MNIKINTDGLNIDRQEILALRPEAGKALDRLWSGTEPMTGWVQTPLQVKESDLEYILNVADIIKDEAGLFVVIGIGGSYLGAKAAIEALPKDEPGVDVRFLGTNFCSDYYMEVLEEIKQKQTIVCVISKSGNTTEVKAGFEIVKDLMIQKYKSEEEAFKRIIAITDGTKGDLKKEADENGYTTMVIPDDVGGRYSVFTPAGLLPMAVSGIDIRALIKGAADMANSPDWDNDGADYAIARHLMQKKGKELEIIEMTHSRLDYLGEWMKQLYGESEGKEGRGLFPVTMTFSTDLHSMGQYLQQGRQMFFETMLVIDSVWEEVEVPGGDLKGMKLSELNDIMVKGVSSAHMQEGIPVVELHMPVLDAFNCGQLLYFLETTCAITALMDGINPFDQPGVEAYKAEMRKLLKNRL